MRITAGPTATHLHPHLRKSGRLLHWMPLLALSIAGLGVVAYAGLRPHNSTRLVAIFPPWWSAGQSLVAASQVAAVTGFGGFSFIVGVQASRPQLQTELLHQGALVIIDGSRFSFCGPPEQGQEK